MRADEREAWYIENEALVQFYAYKVCIWKVGSGMVEGKTPEEAILRMQETMREGLPALPRSEAERRVQDAVVRLLDSHPDAPSTDVHPSDGVLWKNQMQGVLMDLLRQQYRIVEDA